MIHFLAGGTDRGAWKCHALCGGMRPGHLCRRRRGTPAAGHHRFWICPLVVMPGLYSAPSLKLQLPNTLRAQSRLPLQMAADRGGKDQLPNAGAMGAVRLVEAGLNLLVFHGATVLNLRKVGKQFLCPRVLWLYSLSTTARLLYSCNSHIPFQLSPLFNSRPGSWRSLSTCPTDT